MLMSPSELTNAKIISEWKEKPFPLLPLLHAFHDRDDYLSDTVLRAIAENLKIPLAELFGTVTFYHHFSREKNGKNLPRICSGPVCSLRGSQDLADYLKASGQEVEMMACSGRCDEPVAVLRGDTSLISFDNKELTDKASIVPPPYPGDKVECVFRNIRKPNQAAIAGYRTREGYKALERVLAEIEPSGVIKVITESGLSGRGGAGFPTGQKWNMVAQAKGSPKYIVCNADEGEPGCFKDRTIMDYDPHNLIEGMAIAAYAMGISSGFIYLRYEYPETLKTLEKALEDARNQGFLGNNICGSDFDFDLYVRRGAGAYICGEEGSLLNSLEGKHPFPRNKPPFPVTHGLNNLPTAVNNVETLASITGIILNGSDWYKGLGYNGNAGTKLVSLSGDIKKPGNYEIPFGLPLKTLLYEWAGGPLSDEFDIKAVSMAGLSGGFLGGEALEVTLDEPSIRQHGSFLGAAGIIVFDESRNIGAIAQNAMEFFAEESCGKCFPCRIGTTRLTEALEGKGQSNFDAWQKDLFEISNVMQELSACGLGMAAPAVIESTLKYFPEDLKKHINAK